ncbi:MAG: twin-arginine translocase TatA/TatE family subunit [Coriobacteriales bacterium]
MFGISGTELVIILFFGFLIFGPEKLPQMGRTVGRAIRQFRNASEAANKKFKEEVADPFQEAIAPYKDQVEESTKPIQEDISAINDTLNETKSMFTDPFKDMFGSSSNAPAPKPGAAIPGGVPGEPPAPVRTTTSAAAAEDPFASVLDDVAAPQPEGKPIPEAGGTVKKKSMAASLYDLDDVKDGE